MSEITLSLEHPSLGCGEIIARYDLTEIQEKAYKQGGADAIEEFVNFCINDWKMAQAVVVTEEKTDCFRIGGYLARLLEQFKDEYAEQLKEQKE